MTSGVSGPRDGRTGYLTVGGMLVAATLLPLVRVGDLTVDNVATLVGLCVLTTLMALHGNPCPPARLRALFIGFLILAVGSLLTDLIRGGSLPLGTARFLSYAAVICVVTEWSPAMRERLQRLVLMVGAMLSLTILIQSLGFLPAWLQVEVFDLESDSFRFGGAIGHPNFAAYFLGLCILALTWVRKIGRGYWIGLLSLFLVGFMLTGARNAALALLAGFLVIAVRRPKTFVLLAMPTIPLFVYVGDDLSQRFVYLLKTGGLDGENAAGWRLSHWQQALAHGNESWPFGVGWNRYVEYSSDGLAVHNGYLQVYVELGLAGVIGLPTVMLGILAFCMQLQSRGAVALFIYSVIITVSDPGLFYPPIGLAAILLLVGLSSVAEAPNPLHTIAPPASPSSPPPRQRRNSPSFDRVSRSLA